ncbi:HDOD domain-containing protein [Pseudaeromonas sharmana]|uniref:HDOD domain-containing protein n=1 Tax=Pseudaeromonas sharmana TaxID=328412 RepID=A0ABV8CN05_9GAMM
MTPLTSLFCQPQHLPSVPEVVRELMDSFNEPDPDLLNIANQISRDPVITARLLGLANAARFGGGRVITSVREACIRLGLGTVRNLVLACGLTQSVSAVPGIHLGHYWHQVFTVAELAKRLARQGGGNGDLAFTTGLLHALGQLVLHLALPAAALQTLQQETVRSGDVAAQRHLLGYDYALVGAELAQRWKLPAHLVEAIRDHLQPLATQPANQEACIVHLALWLSSLTDALPDDPVENWPAPVAIQCGVSWPDLATVWQLYHLDGHGLASLLNGG